MSFVAYVADYDPTGGGPGRVVGVVQVQFKGTGAGSGNIERKPLQTIFGMVDVQGEQKPISVADMTWWPDDVLQQGRGGCEEDGQASWLCFILKYQC